MWTLDKLLICYINAYAVAFDMTNKSMMVGISMNGNMSDTGMSMNGSTPPNSTLVNTTDYQTAQALAVNADDIFDSQIAEEVKGSANARQSIDNLASVLRELATSVDSKAHSMEIMAIVHIQVHPNLITGFNLKLR